jgi:pSer/pThr/pTyr-binding forkhead associated (FHA) protein
MKSFLAACGIEDSFQFAVENQDETDSRLRLLYQPFAVIGRDVRADVVLDHADVSRRHVYLQVIEGRVFWIDLESRTGTRNESESQRFGWLEGGRTLSVGPYVIRRFVGDSQAVEKRHRTDLSRNTPLVARPSPYATQSEVALEFLNGPSQSMLKPVHRVLSLIGSASGCKFRLTDTSVSRFHGSLLQTSAGLWIVDLLGHKGITINDMPVRCSRLVDGDIVRIGRYQIRIRCRPHVQGSGAGSVDAGNGAFLPKLSRQSRAGLGLNSIAWPSMTASLCSDSIDGQESRPLSIESGSMSPNVGLVRSHSSVPGTFRQSEPTESILVPLVNQFGMMQQQMFDQFQQAMAMMIQMFGTMHRDQMEAIRAELEQLHELTNEFHALKKELAERTQEKPESNSRPEPEPSSAPLNRSPAPAPSDLITPLPSFGPRGNWQGHQVNQHAAPSPQSSAPKTVGQQSRLEPDSQSTQPSATPSVTKSISEPKLKTDSKAPAKPISPGRSPDSDRDTVLWLHKRIMTLQQERESRWQKILKLMPGMSSS